MSRRWSVRVVAMIVVSLGVWLTAAPGDAGATAAIVAAGNAKRANDMGTASAQTCAPSGFVVIVAAGLGVRDGRFMYCTKLNAWNGKCEGSWVGASEYLKTALGRQDVRYGGMGLAETAPLPTHLRGRVVLFYCLPEDQE